MLLKILLKQTLVRKRKLSKPCGDSEIEMWMTNISQRVWMEFVTSQLKVFVNFNLKMLNKVTICKFFHVHYECKRYGLILNQVLMIKVCISLAPIRIVRQTNNFQLNIKEQKWLIDWLFTRAVIKRKTRFIYSKWKTHTHRQEIGKVRLHGPNPNAKLCNLALKSIEFTLVFWSWSLNSKWMNTCSGKSR